MKTVLTICFAFLMILESATCDAKGEKKQTSTKVASNPIEVYYFHFTRRCMTCMAVESEAQKTLESLYSQQMKKGKITFKSMNLDEKSSEATAKKCKAAGQSLLIISGKKRTDLTTQGFMYARNNPDKLKQEIKKVIDPLLNSK